MIPNSPAARDLRVNLHPYSNQKRLLDKGPLVVRSGEGIWVSDDTGKRYIEGMAGLWCASLGFSERRLVDAARRQLETLPYYHLFLQKSHDPAIELAERLLAMAPARMGKVFFANSGSEANDTALKLVWYYNNARGRPKKKKIISRVKAYHGVTVAAASLTGLPNNHRSFDLPIPGILHAECPHFWRFGKDGESEEGFTSRLADSLDALIHREGADTIAAFIAEPVMGAGGVIPPPSGYFEKIQEVLRRHDVLMIADEVICGFGRTGSMFGSETYDIRPDIMTVAKALSSAYQPISAVLLSEEITQAIEAEALAIGTFAHGYTYSAHPVACAVAIETLKIYEERGIVSHVRDIAPRFQERLARLSGLPFIGETRGVGLLGAVELAADTERRQGFPPEHDAAGLVVSAALDEGLMLRGMGDVIAFCPPLVITEPEIDDLFDRFERAYASRADELGRIAREAATG